MKRTNDEPKMTPTELASLLIERWREGETLTNREIRSEYGVTNDTSSRAIGISRTILREQYDLCLPVAHAWNDYQLTVTDNPVHAFHGELPQVRDYQTRGLRLAERLIWMGRLVRDNPQMMQRIMVGVDGAMVNLNNMLGIAEEQIAAMVTPPKDEATV